MLSRHKILFASLLLIIILLGLIGYLQYDRKLFMHHEPSLKTYFQYSEAELKGLQALSSDQVLSEDSLKKWDEILFNLVKKYEFGDGYAARVYTYVYIAQREAAFLSYNASGNWQGTFDEVTAQTLCLFFKDECATFSEKKDTYSDYLASLVVAKLKKRMEDDKESTRAYKQLEGKNYWAGVKPYYGQDFGSWKTWIIQSGSQFRAPKPPEATDKVAWDAQLKETKTALINATDQQKEAVVFWAGGPGTITPPGQWLTILNDYLWKEKVPLQKALNIRAVLAMGMMDAIISVFDSKYSYWTKRPFMRDSDIITVMPTPNHPGYPAGHSTISGAAYTILTFYFPEQKTYWLALAEEASHSRIWGGIHLPLDASAGMQMGIKVGEVVIQSESK